MDRFSGKRIIVTGAGSGIGQGTALRLAREGGNVAAVDVSADGLATTMARAGEEGTAERMATFTADLSKEAEVDTMVSAALGVLGGLDVVVNAAGIIKVARTMECSFEDFNRLMAVNVGSTFLMTRRCLPAMIEAGGGVFVNFGSTSVQFGHPYMAAYAATKGAIVSFTHSIALEYSKQNIRAVSVCPGGITTGITDLVANTLPADADWSLFAKIQPLAGTFGTPEHIAGVIAMVASDDGAWVNGTEIRVDGGAHC